MADYDVLVIGGGPGGYVAGSYLAQYGKNTAIVEKGLPGGCCLNTGCIPTKTLLEAAARFILVNRSEHYGIKVQNVSFSWESLKKHSETIRDDLRNGVTGLLRSRKCEMINGEASFVDAHTVRIGENNLTADSIIIATGAQPVIPGKYSKFRRVITSDTFWDLKKQPESIVIAGGGVIGCEIASALSRLGTKVTIVEQMSEILPVFDAGAVNILRDELVKYGVDIVCGHAVSDIAETKNGLCVVVGGNTLKCDYLLWATGRCPVAVDMGGLSLKKTEKGFFKVDKNYRTSVKNIFCIGDANGKEMLAHAAISQAMNVVKFICTDIDICYDPVVPQTVFTHPAIAKIGISENECQNAAVGKVPYAAAGYSHVADEETGFFKVIRDIETDTLVGAEIAGYHACELIHNLAPYINKKLPVSMFADIMYAHPTLTEGIRLAVEASYIRSPQI